MTTLHLLLGIAVGLVVLLGPQAWRRRVCLRHDRPREDLPGTGGELALHLLNRSGLGDVVIEPSVAGDEYDPGARAVRLSPAVLEGRSVTAAATAAHVVGHALQHHVAARPLEIRVRLNAVGAFAQKAGAAAVIAVPFVAVLTQMPSVGLGMLLLGLVSLSVPVIVNLLVLPLELDASFGWAFPVLARGYLAPRDLLDAREVLLACAVTELADSLAVIPDFRRWIALLRG